MKRMNKFLKQLAVVVLALSFTPISSAFGLPQLTFTLQDVEVNGLNQKVLVPFVAEIPGGNVNVRVTGMLSQLNMVRPDLYQNVQVNLDPGFIQNGKVSVETGILEGENLTHVISELYYSLSVLGMTEMAVPALGGEIVRASAIPYPVASLIVPGWKALPPAQYKGVLIRVSDSSILTAKIFYQKLAARDGDLGAELAEGLQSSNARVRAAVAQNMGSLSVDNAVSKLIPLTKDADREVRIAVIRALDNFRTDPAAQGALESVVQNDSESSVKTAAVQVLVNAGRNEFQVFLSIEKLGDPNPMVVIDAIGKLAEAKNPAASSSLVDVLMHNSPEVREAAIAGLMRGKNGAGLQRGLQMQGVSDDVKLQLAKAMTGLPEASFVDEGLSYIVVAGSAEESKRAAEALGSRKSVQGISALVEGLSHPDMSVQVTAAEALGQIGDPSGLSPLAEYVQRTQGQAQEAGRNAAVLLLKSLSLDQVIDFSNNSNVMLRRLALESLGAFAQGGRNLKVVQELRNKLMDTDTSIRQAAAVSLSEIEDPSIASLFKTMMSDADPIVRSRVAVTLGWSRDPSAGTTLVEMLKDSNSEVKRQAANSLARRKDRGGLEELLKYVTYGKPEVRVAIVSAIVAVSTPADNEKLMPIYQNALYDQEVAVKLSAVEGMARNLGTPAAPTAISNLASVIIDPSEDVQKLVVQSLGTAKDPMATEPIARALFSDFKSVKVIALDAMLTNGQENADKPLQEFISNEQDPELLKKANDVYDQLGL